MGIIFDIQRFCIHDGPGIRTTVFLKGCPLRCIWCSNPESQQTGPQFMFSKDRCMGCMECLRACPEHQPPSSASYLEGTCRLCGSCEAVCPRGAISQKGLRNLWKNSAGTPLYFHPPVAASHSPEESL